MAACVPSLPRAVQDERGRRVALAPFLVPAPKRGILGRSRYAQALRSAVLQAAKDPSRWAAAAERCAGRGGWLD